jgi:hypothetical protein
MIADFRDGSIVITANDGVTDTQFLLDIFKYWNTRYYQPDNFRPVSQDIINYLKEYV